MSAKLEVEPPEPSERRAAGPSDWARIAAGGNPPAWWPLVRTLTVDGITPLEPVEALQAIESLRFGQRAELVGLEALARLPALRELLLGGLGREGLFATPPLPLLERLSVAAESLPDDLARRFPALRSLSLAYSGTLERLPALPAELLELDLTGCAQLERIDEITGCAGLRSLDLHRCDRLLDLSSLSRLASLERLRLDARRPRSLDPVARCSALRELWIGEGSERVDLRPLQGHPGLRLLGLAGCTTVAGLPALSALPALEELHVLRCGIDALPDLTASPALRVLNLEGLPALRILPRLAPGQELALLRLVDLVGLPPGSPRPSAHRTVAEGTPP